MENIRRSSVGGLMKEHQLPTPCYMVDENLLIKNLTILKNVKEHTGCRILLAQKAFSMYHFYPLIAQYLDGTTASGLYEAKLGYDKMGSENHIFSPAYKKEEFDEISDICDHIVFNSVSQYNKFSEIAVKKGRSIGLRINPECSTQEDHAIYDPCAFGSRLGITLSNFPDELPENIDGLHFHTLCEQNSDDLEITLSAVENKFGKYLSKLKWLNLGGGHHITRKDYDIPLLEKCIDRIQNRYGIQVYLEPGEAVALNAGFLISSVMETLKNGTDIAILDASAACHMPDVLEMPYRPPLKDSGNSREKAFTYRLAGNTCLAGDVIGDYSFDHPLKEGDKLIFEDMAIYSMVKNNTFNGIQLPYIAVKDINGDCKIIRKFGYEDFKCRL